MIADSSVLILYARAGRLELLRDLFGTLELPPEVRTESVDAAPHRPDAQAIAAAIGEGWVRVEAPPARAVGALVGRLPNLGRGELAVLALAQARQEAVVLLDDVLARHAAMLLGLRSVGSLGVLALAHRRKALRSKDEVAAALRGLLENGLWVGADVVEAFWERLGGRPK